VDSAVVEVLTVVVASVAVVGWVEVGAVLSSLDAGSHTPHIHGQLGSMKIVIRASEQSASVK
jgi:hypothetical protein